MFFLLLGLHLRGQNAQATEMLINLSINYDREPVPIKSSLSCGNQRACFNLQVPMNTTILQTYNCDRQSGPKKEVMPAEKQLYRPDYVLQHFIHYSSVTVLAQMSRSEFEKAGYAWLKTKLSPDPNSRFSDEVNEATMLHAKSVARQDTAGWLDMCKVDFDKTKLGRFEKKASICRIGVPYPRDYTVERNGEGDEKGWTFNCYVNAKTEKHWVPKLEAALKDRDVLSTNN